MDFSATKVNQYVSNARYITHIALLNVYIPKAQADRLKRLKLGQKLPSPLS